MLSTFILLITDIIATVKAEISSILLGLEIDMGESLLEKSENIEK